MVGIHKARDASGYCFRSRQRRNSTNMVQRVSANIGGMGKGYRLSIFGSLLIWML
jgi:hypothetical protein